FHGFGGRKNHHPGREKHALRRLPVHCSQKPRSRAGREQGNRLVQRQDSGGDLRRYQGRRRCTYARDDGGGISLRAEEVNPTMRGPTLITAGAIGATRAARCFMTPLLVLVFGAVGLTAWLAKADYVLIPALILCLALIAFGLYRKRLHHG